MDRCNDLCTKDATGTCALCEARAEADRFWRFWVQGGWILAGGRALNYWLSATPLPIVPRHRDVVRESHKQYADTLNKIMLTVLAVGLFCVLTVVGSPDQWLLAPESTVKVPLADTSLSLLAFVIVTPFLLVVLTGYLHLVFGYWLVCERERLHLNQQPQPGLESLIESPPMLFAFPDTTSRVLTGFIFYWFVPVV